MIQQLVTVKLSPLPHPSQPLCYCPALFPIPSLTEFLEFHPFQLTYCPVLKYWTVFGSHGFKLWCQRRFLKKKLFHFLFLEEKLPSLKNGGDKVPVSGCGEEEKLWQGLDADVLFHVSLFDTAEPSQWLRKTCLVFIPTWVPFNLKSWEEKAWGLSLQDSRSLCSQSCRLTPLTPQAHTTWREGTYLLQVIWMKNGFVETAEIPTKIKSSMACTGILWEFTHLEWSRGLSIVLPSET